MVTNANWTDIQHHTVIVSKKVITNFDVVAVIVTKVRVNLAPTTDVAKQFPNQGPTFGRLVLAQFIKDWTNRRACPRSVTNVGSLTLKTSPLSIFSFSLFIFSSIKKSPKRLKLVYW